MSLKFTKKKPLTPKRCVEPPTPHPLDLYLMFTQSTSAVLARCRPEKNLFLELSLLVFVTSWKLRFTRHVFSVVRSLRCLWPFVHCLINCHTTELTSALVFCLQVLISASFIGALCLFSSVCIVCAISAFTLPIETRGRALQVSFTSPGASIYRHAT